MNFNSIMKTLDWLNVPIVIPNTNKEGYWTKKSYDDLLVGDENTGIGGVSYDIVKVTYGKPDTNTKHRGSRTLTYSTINETACTISLTFIKQKDGRYLLSQKTQIGLT